MKKGMVLISAFNNHMTDIYYRQQAFESESALIRKAHLTGEDKIFEFINERADLSLSRRIRYMVTLRTARAFLNKPFTECTKEDLCASRRKHSKLGFFPYAAGR